MKDKSNPPTPCVIRDSAISYARRAGLLGDSTSAPEECQVIESVRKLLALGLSAEDIEDLDVRQPMLQAICEYARLDDGAVAVDHSPEAATSTLNLIEDQVHNLELEIQMLNLRRRALRRRLRVLDKLAQSLKIDETDPLAA